MLTCTCLCNAMIRQSTSFLCGMLFCIELYNAAMYYHSRPIPTYLSRPIPLELVLGLITVKSRMEVLA